MTYAIEHFQQALVDNQITSKWCTWETFEDKELAEKELSNLLLRFDPVTFRLTHTPD
tara:strand:+ start:1199 stop:1369 length:171 start_codon:yes stop_codon:yes gene_type:complete